MNWSQATNEFQNALDLARSHALRLKATMRGHGVFDKKAKSFIEESEQELLRIEKGKQFLASLEKIKEFCPDIEEKVLVDFLKAASKALRKTQDPDNYKTLSKFQKDLSSMITPEDKELIKFEMEGEKGSSLIGVACLAGSLFFVGVVTFTAAPVVLLAIGVAAAIVSLIITALFAYQAYEKNQFFESEQEISAFVQTFDLKPPKPMTELSIGEDFSNAPD